MWETKFNLKVLKDRAETRGECMCAHLDGPLPSFVTENVAIFFVIRGLSHLNSFFGREENGTLQLGWVVHPLLVSSEIDPTPHPQVATATIPFPFDQHALLSFFLSFFLIRDFSS